MRWNYDDTSVRGPRSKNTLIVSAHAHSRNGPQCTKTAPGLVTCRTRLECNHHTKQRHQSPDFDDTKSCIRTLRRSHLPVHRTAAASLQPRRSDERLHRRRPQNGVNIAPAHASHHDRRDPATEQTHSIPAAAPGKVDYFAAVATAISREHKAKHCSNSVTVSCPTDLCQAERQRCMPARDVTGTTPRGGVFGLMPSS